MNKNIRKMCISALFASLCAVATIAFPITLPVGGYVNFGDMVVILSGVFLGPVYGFVSAAIGSALADILLGYFNYAVATFLIKGLMAVVACFTFKGLCTVLKKRSYLSVFVSSIVSEAVMVGGYFIYDSFLYGVYGATSSLIGNTTQAVFGICACSVLFVIIEKAFRPLWNK